MEARELQLPQPRTEQPELHGFENRHVDAEHAEASESAEAGRTALGVEETGTPTPQVCADNPDANSPQARVPDSLANQSPIEEDETQLVAIRELMTRAWGRGIWLTLGEIAEATEFAEASISAQLRHLRKAHNGGYHVEKRHRRLRRVTAAMRKIRNARRGPVIWEYRVVPAA